MGSPGRSSGRIRGKSGTGGRGARRSPRNRAREQQNGLNYTLMEDISPTGMKSEICQRGGKRSEGAAGFGAGNFVPSPRGVEVRVVMFVRVMALIRTLFPNIIDALPRGWGLQLEIFGARLLVVFHVVCLRVTVVTADKGPSSSSNGSRSPGETEAS